MFQLLSRSGINGNCGISMSKQLKSVLLPLDVLIYIYYAYALYFVILIVWYVRRTLGGDRSSLNIIYRKSYIGQILKFFSIILLIAAPVILLVTWISEARIPSTVVDGFYFERTRISIISWVFTFILFFTVKVFQQKLRLFFYLRSSIVHPRSKYMVITPDKDYKYISKYFSDKEQLVLIKKENDRIFYDYMAVRYHYDEISDMFIDNVSPNEINIDRLRQLNEDGGLGSDEVEDMLYKFGYNEIEYKVENMYKSLGKELFGYIFLLQCFLIYASMYFRAYVGAVLWPVMSFAGILYKTYLTFKTRRNIKSVLVNMSITNVYVKRNGLLVQKYARDLVLNDIVLIENDMLVPCDMVLIQGQAITDEASLTGESLPVQKFECNENMMNYETECKNHCLFTGTSVVGVTGVKNKEDAQAAVYAAVIRKIGASTKGKMMESILYAQHDVLKWSKEIPYIMLIILTYATIIFVVMSYISGFNIASFYIGIGTISILCPVWVPVLIAMAENYRASKLSSSHNICCLKPELISTCGEIDTFFFDKTGTLTTTGTAFKDVIVYKETNGLLISSCFACCHSLSKVKKNDSEEIMIGSNVDKEMHNQADSFAMNDIKTTINRDTLPIEVLKTFPFDHNRQCMSVVAVLGNGEHLVFTKGSMDAIEKRLSTPIDVSYKESTKHYSKKGYYIIAIAYRYLYDVDNVPTMARDKAESDLVFMGIVLFENKVKPEAKAALSCLDKGDIRAVILTGDCVYTAIAVAKEVELVKEERIIVGDCVNDELQWKNYQTDELISSDDLMCYTDIAVTSSAYYKLLLNMDLFYSLIFNIKVFARMKPLCKADVIIKFRDMGDITGMCGDGDNDCAALRAAHAGLAMSNAEAAAIAPFSSRDKNMNAPVNLIREGRACSEICISCYMFMLLYGFLYTGVKLILLLISYACLPDFVIIYVDCFVIALVAITMTRSKPCLVISKKKPNSSLLHPYVVWTCISMVAINVIFLVCALYLLRVWHSSVRDYNMSLPYHQWWLRTDNVDAATASLWYIYNLVSGSILLSLGGRNRKPFYFNYKFVAISGILFVFTIYLHFEKPKSITCLFRINCDDKNYSYLRDWVWLHYISFVNEKFMNIAGSNIFHKSWKFMFLSLILLNCLVNGIINSLLLKIHYKWDKVQNESDEEEQIQEV